ncbi:MAG: NAD(P)/FAD-dependent oxidoreductase [Pseudomonadales bacterium]
MERIDVLIVGGGISGVGAACYIHANCPDKTYAVLEARDAIGGTWDLFRYPGIRSDSDMYTMGYAFRPWLGDKALADGESIRNYISDTANENKVNEHIRTGHRATSANWHTETACWQVEVMKTATGEVETLECGFLYICTGYYDYDKPHAPEFASSETFKGKIVHPQLWPETLDYEDKRVVVIGSGATAVTLVPAMTDKAAHVTMLQRTPTYVLSVSEVDSLSTFLRQYLPNKISYSITRWKNILMGMLVYQLCTRRPEWAKAYVRKGVTAMLAPDYDIDKHFTPSYEPWDQRLCMVPNGDLFHVINEGKATVVTDHIECFTDNGIQLKSGETLEADIIITATGLKMKLFDEIPMSVDGEPVVVPEKTVYQGMMLSDVPNMAFTLGYTNASWTLKADLAADFITRVLNYMDKHNYRQCCPLDNSGEVHDEPIMTLKSGYIERALGSLPREGKKAPWKMYQNYVLDKLTFKLASLDDGNMEFKP